MMSAILLPRISVAKAVRGFVIGSLLLPVLWIGMVSIGIGENPATAVLFAIALIAGGLHLWYLVKSARPLKVSQDLKGLTINLDLLTSLSEKLHSAEMTAKTQRDPKPEEVAITLDINELHIVERMVDEAGGATKSELRNRFAVNLH